jgi:hypothetical protein
MIIALSQAGYDAAAVRRLARAQGVTVGAAAQALHRWVRAGCAPTTEQLVELLPFGIDLHRTPAAAALARLRELIGSCSTASDTQLGLLLVTVGSVPDVAAWLLSGVTDAAVAAREIAAGHPPKTVTSQGARG